MVFINNRRPQKQSEPSARKVKGRILPHGTYTQSVGANQFPMTHLNRMSAHVR